MANSPVSRYTFFFAFIFLSGCIFWTAQAEASSAKRQYLAADACYKELRNSTRQIKYHSSWVRCIEKYQDVYRKFPTNSWAPAGMYKAAQLYDRLYKISGNPTDQAHSIDLFNRLIQKYPSSAYRYRSERQLKAMAPVAPAPDPPAARDSAKKDTDQIVQKKSTKRLTKKDIPPQPPEEELQEPEDKEHPLAGITVPSPQTPSVPPTTDTMITDLRFWSNPEYTRIVIDAEDERPYTHRLLKRDPSINVPFQRLYVDIEKTRLDKNVPEHTPINDNLLKQTRAGQYTSHTVRVVVDIKSFDNYKIFSLKDPFRIVIDVWGTDANGKALGDTEAVAQTQPPVKPSRITTDNLMSSDIARQLALNVKTIVIDPGHGGKDPGAPGYLKGVWEKDLVLEMAKKLAYSLQHRLNCTVLLTRGTDKYLTLEERTAIANTRKADLFISLHSNASKNRKLKGIETYFLNLATDEKAIAVAARENATSKKNISDLETILNDLMKNAKIKESSRLATDVHSCLVAGMQKKYSGVNDLGVKQAPFYVLLGARMPSILIETSFISNSTECKRLVSASYQKALVNSITDGIEKYINATNPQQL